MAQQLHMIAGLAFAADRDVGNGVVLSVDGKMHRLSAEQAAKLEGQLIRLPHQGERQVQIGKLKVTLGMADAFRLATLILTTITPKFNKDRQ